MNTPAYIKHQLTLNIYIEYFNLIYNATTNGQVSSKCIWLRCTIPALFQPTRKPMRMTSLTHRVQRLQQSFSTPRFVPDLPTISEGQPSFFGSCPRVSYHSESYITKYVEYATLIFPKGLSRQSVSHGGAHRTLNGNQERRSLSARAFPGCMN